MMRTLSIGTIVPYAVDCRRDADAQSTHPMCPIGIAPIPYPASKPHLRQPTWIGQNMFCIPRESRYPREAWDFFVWIQSEEAQLLFAETMHGLPNIWRVVQHLLLRTVGRPDERWKQGSFGSKPTPLNSRVSCADNTRWLG
ncbi:MAG: hypothetical protein ACUVR1_09995 [Fimbriimonadales bacterium]